MIARIVAIAFALDAVALADATPPVAETRSSNGFVLHGQRGVIVPAAKANFFYFGKKSGFWTPTHAEVAKLEAALPAYLKGARTSELWKRWPKYWRQYVGIVDGKTRWIWTNAFCSERFVKDGTWLGGGEIFVFEGGECYFRIQFDPASGRFRLFDTNAEA